MNGGAFEAECEPSKVKFFDRERGRTFIHPSSICFSVGKYESSWLVYTEMTEVRARQAGRHGGLACVCRASCVRMAFFTLPTYLPVHAPAVHGLIRHRDILCRSATLNLLFTFPTTEPLPSCYLLPAPPPPHTCARVCAQTSKLFVRESSMVPVYALLLFGGALRSEPERQRLFVDDWVEFTASERIGAMVRGVRAQLDALLTAKIADPLMDLSGSKAVAVAQELLSTDGF